jgi:hypothetical protein
MQHSELAARIVRTRTAWLESHGVPVSHEFADFAEAVGEGVDALRDSYSTTLAPVYLAEQIFFHVLMHGGEGNPFIGINNRWFVEVAAPKIHELLTTPYQVEAEKK